MLPALGSHSVGDTFCQYLLCTFETCHTVSVPTADACIGDSRGGASPNNTFVTARADAEIASKLYPPCEVINLFG